MRLFKSFNKYKNNIAIIDNNTNTLSYKQVLIETNKIKKKVKEKSLILIISENSVGSILAYIFCIINNHVGIIIDSKTSNQNIIKIFKKYDPNYIFISEKNKNMFIKNCFEIYVFFNHSLLKNKVNKQKKINKNLSLLLSTSGSMGSVKFVKLSKTNLKHNADSIINYLKINNKDIAITNLPSSYSYMISIINTHFEVGGSIIISKYSLIEKSFWKIFNKNKVTSFNGVPYTYEMLTKIGINNIKSKSLKYLTHAGGKLDKIILKKIIKFCTKNNLKFFSMYGQTEASPRISYLNHKYNKQKIGSIGKGMLGSKLYLIDKSGEKILKPFVEGELVCEGKNVFMGYSENYNDLKKSNEKDYKLRTGDLGYFDKEGFYYITSRVNKIAKIFGNRVDLGVLETLMSQRGYKIACLYDNNKIFVYFENKYNKTKLANTLSKITNLNIQPFKLTKLRCLPRTSNNKVSYNQLRKINA